MSDHTWYLSAYATFALLYFIYPFGAVLFTTTCSYAFNKVDSSGQSGILYGVGTLLGVLPFFFVVLFKIIGNFYDDYETWGTLLHAGCSFLSPCYIPFGIFAILSMKYNQCRRNDALRKSYNDSLIKQFGFGGKGCEQLTFGDYMSDVDIYILFIACLFHLVFWFVALKIVDVKKDGGKASSAFACTRKMLETRKARSQSSPDEESDVCSEWTPSNADEDVLNERKALMAYFSQGFSDKAVALKDIGKKYKASCALQCNPLRCKRGKNGKLAVKSVSLGVSNGEVFGLLGPNGAGKTTIMKMIIAEESPSRGQVKIGKYLIQSNDSEGFQFLGYCPQFDAVWGRITIREHLEAYAAIRGIPPAKIQGLIKEITTGLRIEEHANKQARACSGGTKRKLRSGH